MSNGINLPLAVLVLEEQLRRGASPPGLSTQTDQQNNNLNLNPINQNQNNQNQINQNQDNQNRINQNQNKLQNQNPNNLQNPNLNNFNNPLLREAVKIFILSFIGPDLHG